MSLADDLLGPVEVQGRMRCRMGLLLDGLEPDERAALKAALADGRRTSTWIVATLGRNGHEIGPETVGRHRRGTCRCPR